MRNSSCTLRGLLALCRGPFGMLKLRQICTFLRSNSAGQPMISDSSPLPLSPFSGPPGAIVIIRGCVCA